MYAACFLNAGKCYFLYEGDFFFVSFIPHLTHIHPQHQHVTPKSHLNSLQPMLSVSWKLTETYRYFLKNTL